MNQTDKIKVLFNNGGIPMWMTIDKSELSKFKKENTVFEIKEVKEECQKQK